MKKKLIYLLIFITILSCNEKNDDSEKAKHTVKINCNNLQILDTAMFESFKYTVLETNDNSLIGTIEKLYITDSLIVIFDSKKMAITVFNSAGKYLYNIGRKGPGPDEYLYINDIFFDKKTQLIYVHERYQNRIYTYRLSGELISKSKVAKYSFDSFCKTAEGYWVYSCYKDNNPDGYNLMLLDDSLQTVKSSFFPQKEFFYGENFSFKFICDEQGNLYFFYPTSNFIYRLLDKNVIPYYKIDFGNKTMPYKQILNLTDSQEYNELVADKKYLGDIQNPIINNGYLCFSFKESGYNIAVNQYFCIFNTNDNKNFIYSNPYISKHKYPVQTKVNQIIDNKFVFILEPGILSDNSFSILSNDLSEPVNAESNPVLCIFELKKNYHK